MAKTIPDWAIKKALEPYANYCHRMGLAPDWSVEMIKGAQTGWSDTILAFAADIAEHEEPPVDPVLKRAREIFDKHHGHNHEDVFEGRWDGNCNMLAILEALKDGKSED